MYEMNIVKLFDLAFEEFENYIKTVASDINEESIRTFIGALKTRFDHEIDIIHPYSLTVIKPGHSRITSMCVVPIHVTDRRNSEVFGDRFMIIFNQGAFYTDSLEIKFSYPELKIIGVAINGGEFFKPEPTEKMSNRYNPRPVL